MKALAISIGYKTPVPALLKILSEKKEQGWDVFYNQDCEPDEVFISVCFTKDKAQALGTATYFNCPVHFGGPAFGGKMLEDSLEHRLINYSLFGLSYALGSTTKGCSRACAFCSVNRMEGNLREHSLFPEFILPSHKKALLFDNNFALSNRAGDKLDWLIARKLKVSIMQGIDARVLAHDKGLARQFAQLQLYDHKFANKAYYTAWDRIEDENEVLQGIDNLIEAGVNPLLIRPYVLTKYNTTLEQDVYRLKKLRDRGTVPFLMAFNNQHHVLKHWGTRYASVKTIPIEDALPKVIPIMDKCLLGGDR
jgi:hypothetical protein